ncbi:prolactin isoform X1, partial [Sigmodon hispidus]
MLLLLLLVCENVASVPRCIMKDEGCQEVLRHIFNMTSNTSESIHLLSSETLQEFDSQYDPSQKFQNKPPMTCHTASLSIPNSKRKAQRMQPLALMNVIIRILAAWKNLLYHVKDSMANLDETPYAIISKVVLINGQIKNLTENMQDIKTIFSQ